MLSRDACLQPDTRNLCGTSGNVFENPLAPNEPTASCLGNVCARSFSATHCDLASPNTRRSVANMAELERPHSKLCKTCTEICQEVFHLESSLSCRKLIRIIAWLNCRGVSQASEMHFDKFPDSSTFQSWNTSSKTEVSSCSGFTTEAMLRIIEVEMVDSVDDLMTSRAIRDHHFPNFEMLDAKIASALNKTIQNSYFKKYVNLEEQKTQVEHRFLRGRQTAFMINEHIRVTGAHEAVLDCSDLFRVTLQGDDVQDFDMRWDDVLLSIRYPHVLESVYKMRIRESDQLQTVLAMYE